MFNPLSISHQSLVHFIHTNLIYLSYICWKLMNIDNNNNNNKWSLVYLSLILNLGLLLHLIKWPVSWVKSWRVYNNNNNLISRNENTRTTNKLEFVKLTKLTCSNEHSLIILLFKQILYQDPSIWLDNSIDKRYKPSLTILTY